MATNGLIEGKQIGYLAADPTFKKNANGSMVSNFRLLTNMSYTLKDSDKPVDETVGIFYELWGKSAENFVSFMKKGSRVCVDFTIRNDEYEDPANPGKKIYRDRYRVTKWLSLTPKSGSDDYVGGEENGALPHESP